MKSKLKAVIKKSLKNFGLEIRNSRFAYIDPLDDIARILSGVSNPVIFDVGANYGNTAIAYQSLFSDSLIYAFEPTPEVVKSLQSRFKDVANIVIIPKAISNTVGTTTFTLMSKSEMNSVLSFQMQRTDYYGATEQTKITVETTTIADFCRDHRIQHISLLKLDIQGTEKLALSGAKEMLALGHIDTVYLEIHFSRVYEGQTSFGEIEQIMNASGYRLYGFYELNREANGCLDYCNALYVSPKMYAQMDAHYLF